MRQGKQSSWKEAKPRARTNACSISLSDLPTEPVPIDSGFARLELDPPWGVTLFVNDVPSSYLDLTDPGFLGFEYFQQMDAVVQNTHSGPLKALHLGAAGCALARAWAAQWPGSRQIAVDIDGRLLDLARTWFALPRAPELRTRTQDAFAAVIAAKAASFDVVVRDVFAKDQTPTELTTTDFNQAVNQILLPNGIYLANCADRPPFQQAKKEISNLSEVFSQVAVIGENSVMLKKRYGNLVLAATNSENDLFTSPSLARKLRTLPTPARIMTGPELRYFTK